MSEFNREVREEAANRANALGGYMQNITADTICDFIGGRALCQAVQDGALHLDHSAEITRLKTLLEEALDYALSVTRAFLAKLGDDNVQG